MSKLLFVSLILVIASSCKVDASDYNVKKLFTVDGCTVYSFEVGLLSSTKYFTTCQGSTISKESCGKNCTKDVEITTALKTK